MEGRKKERRKRREERYEFSGSELIASKVGMRIKFPSPWPRAWGLAPAPPRARSSPK